MSGLNDEKLAARQAGFARRKLAHADNDGQAMLAANHLLDWLEGQQIGVVSGYIPIQSEMDVLPALRSMSLTGLKICVPVILAPKLPLKFRRWTPDCHMEAGAFGALIPSSGSWLDPDLIICPLVAFDGAGQRMGYGGGFYDRSLAEMRASRSVTALGFAYAKQETSRLPVEATDERLDGVVTENGVVMF